MTVYVPDRNEIVWLDFEPTKGVEICKRRAVLVLSSKQYNKQTSLIICCPISTSARGAVTEVAVGNLEQPSVVVSSLMQTFSWKERQACLITQAESGVMEQVLVRILPLIGADSVIGSFID